MNSKPRPGGLMALRRDTLRKVRQVGVLKTLGHGAQKLIRNITVELAPQNDPRRDPFDAMYGTDTARIISVGALDIPDAQLEHSNRYEAVVPEVFDKIVTYLPIRHEDYVFVDVGSGKGRALLLASRFPFREIIGVEISAALTEIACDNVRIFGASNMKCPHIRTLCSDAVLFDLPVEKMVLYLNNPFDAQVMRSFISKLEKSVRDVPRKLFVAYQRPLHRVLWDESDCFKVVNNTDRYVIYESR